MPTAFKATYSDWKLVKTRQVVQIVFEVPLAEADAAYEVLGGMPAPAAEHWFGIAAIRPETEVVPNNGPLPEQNDARPRQAKQPRPDGAKRDWRDLQPAQQAGIRCDDPIFIAFLKSEYAEDWREFQNSAELVRVWCSVGSRSELNTNHKARVLWTQLDDQFQAWKQVEHA